MASWHKKKRHEDNLAAKRVRKEHDQAQKLFTHIADSRFTTPIAQAMRSAARQKLDKR